MVVYLFHYSTIKCIQRNAIICNFCNILQHLFHSNIVEALANTTLLAIIVNFIGNIVNFIGNNVMFFLAIVKPHFYSMSESQFLLAIVKPHFYSMSRFHSENGMELHIQLHSGKVYITETRTRH